MQILDLNVSSYKLFEIAGFAGNFREIQRFSTLDIAFGFKARDII
jgi:hypothetical protein